MKRVGVDAFFDELKTLGEEERKTIEIAEKVSDISVKIIEARIARGMTQKQLAEKCGMTQSAIARLESLKAIPRIDTLVRVASELDLDVTLTEKK